MCQRTCLFIQFVDDLNWHLSHLQYKKRTCERITTCLMSYLSFSNFIFALKYSLQICCILHWVEHGISKLQLWKNRKKFKIYFRYCVKPTYTWRIKMREDQFSFLPLANWNFWGHFSYLYLEFWHSVKSPELSKISTFSVLIDLVWTLLRDFSGTVY